MKKRISAIHIFAVLLAAAFIFSAAAHAQAASKKTVYVISEVYYAQKTGDPVYVYKYNSKGLLKSYTLGKVQKGEYKYNKKNQLTKFRRSLNEWCNCDYTYNRKGQITKIRNYYTNLADNKFAYDGFKTKLTYNRKGQVIKKVDTGKEAIGEDSALKKVTYTTTYQYNNKGQIKKSVMVSSANKDYKITNIYKYDKKGNLKSQLYTDAAAGFSQNNESQITYDKKGNVASIAGSYSVTVLYNWKKVKVSKELAPLVKAQQWSLVNMDLNFAIPVNARGM